MKTPPIVSREEWFAAREKILPKEKELVRARDASLLNVGGCPGWPLTRNIGSTAPPDG